MSTKELKKTLTAAENMDWDQVVGNGGPPCFALMKNGRFCGRAKRWIGHDTKACPNAGHSFIPLVTLLKSVSIKEATP